MDGGLCIILFHCMNSQWDIRNTVSFFFLIFNMKTSDNFKFILNTKARDNLKFILDQRQGTILSVPVFTD